MLTNLPIKPLEDVEREHILQVLERLNYNRTRTAKALKIGLKTLQRKLIKWDMQRVGLDLLDRREEALPIHLKILQTKLANEMAEV